MIYYKKRVDGNLLLALSCFIILINWKIVLSKIILTDAYIVIVVKKYTVHYSLLKTMQWTTCIAQYYNKSVSLKYHSISWIERYLKSLCLSVCIETFLRCNSLTGFLWPRVKLITQLRLDTLFDLLTKFMI